MYNAIVIYATLQCKKVSFSHSTKPVLKKLQESIGITGIIKKNVEIYSELSGNYGNCQWIMDVFKEFWGILEEMKDNFEGI